MQKKVVKWYNLFWTRLAGVFILVVLVYLGATKTVSYYNLNEYLKTEIETQKKKIVQLDSLYQGEKKKKEKVRIIRERIQVGEDIDKVKKLEKELEELRKQLPVEVKELSPEDLDIYFRNLIKK